MSAPTRREYYLLADSAEDRVKELTRIGFRVWTYQVRETHTTHTKWCVEFEILD